MSERRMFAKTIIDSDAFLDMPSSAQALYFHLGMRADDEGFVNSPKKIMRAVGSNDDDLRLLIAKRFLIPFDSGVVVIKHWRIHNYIRGDRLRPTAYEDERAALSVKANGAYTLTADSQPSVTCPSPVSQLTDTCQSNDGQLPADRPSSDSIGKDSIGQDSIGQDKKSVGSTSSRMTRPSAEDVEAFCREKGITIDAQAFIDYYTANGWRVGKSPMKSWQAAVRNWARRDAERQAQAVAPKKTSFHNFEQRETAGGSWSELDTFTPDDEEEDESWEDILGSFQTTTGRSEH